MEDVFLFSVFFAFSFNDIYVLIYDNHWIIFWGWIRVFIYAMPHFVRLITQEEIVSIREYSYDKFSFGADQAQKNNSEYSSLRRIRMLL